MACSLLGTAMLAGTAAAQYTQFEERTPAPFPVYNTRFSPWPSERNSTLPQRPVTMPPAPPPMPGQNSAAARTLYFKKEAMMLQPASAVLAPPVAAQDAKPKTSTPQLMTDPKIDEPTPAQLFRLETESTLIDRENMDRRAYNKTVKRKEDEKKELTTFPALEALTKAPYTPRSYAQMAIQTEPHYVCYGRLLFEEKNTERYGWDLGPMQPFVSSGAFLVNAALLPYKFCSFPRLRYDCGAGLCLPGDPVPYYLYPPGLNATGGLAEAGAIVALYFLLP